MTVRRWEASRCWCAVLCCAVIAAVSSALPADELFIDFEDDQPFTVVGDAAWSLDEAYSGDLSLYLGSTGGAGRATLALPAGFLNRDIVVSMMVFDMGKWIDRTVLPEPPEPPSYPTGVYGPRWGVSYTDDPGQYAGVTIMEKTSLASGDGYGYNHDFLPGEGAGQTRFGSWFSYSWYGGPRLCTLSDDGGSSVYNEETETWDWTMGTPGVGQWSKWTFEVTDEGVATFYRTGGSQRVFDINGPATEVWAYGGRDNATSGLPLAGVYIDDVRIWASDPLPLPTVLDFEGESSNPFSGGAVTTDQAHSGTQSLYLGGSDMAFVPLDIPGDYEGDAVEVTMMVFDTGRWIDRAVTGYPLSCYGPRWGVSGAGTDIGATIIEKTFLQSGGQYGGGYGHSGGNPEAEPPTLPEDRFANDWFSPAYYGGPRQCTLSDNGGTNDGGGWVMGTEGTGEWTKWIFLVDKATNTVTLSREGGPEVVHACPLDGPVDEIWIYGGGAGATSGLPLAGIYIDDVTVSAVTTSVLEITADVAADQSWVYQNTETTTDDRHITTATVSLVSEATPGEVYDISIADDGLQDPGPNFTRGTVTDNRLVDDTMTVEIVGGRVGASTIGAGGAAYNVTITFQGQTSGKIDTAQVQVSLLRIGDIDRDGSLTGLDRQLFNQRLNNVATPYTDRTYDLDGSGGAPTGTDKQVMNQALNNVPLP